ncbi:ABC transporter ATP-binding protein [Actinomarinicola tropica]|uniref:ABC transporter ATP-binding protein n=1 Tax=Actinomarinicola tropica TaxID=2789776 RepID=UPI00189C1253|nr:ABC transporter ATP-binding protein [Actinomarinicola tropica]
MGDIAIRVDDVAKRFRLMHERNSTLKATIMRGGKRADFEEFWAVDGVSFDVPQGSMFGMIGHNGSGKSTLLKCMASILRPDRGSITVEGKMSALLELGAGFHPELTGRENVFLNGSILGMSTRDMRARFDDIVEFSGLARFIDQPVKNYSSGMFVRLGFSVAINVEPDVLLVDEVMAVGDEQFQQRCVEKFASLRAQGRTIVVVSHGLESLRNQCDTVAWLAEGKLKGLGSAGEVIDAYLAEVRSRDVDAIAASHADDAFTDVGIELITLDGAGERTRTLATGQPATFRTRFVPPAEPDEVDVTLEVARPDGMVLSRSTSRVASGVSGKVDVVDYGVDRLPLLAGVYDLSVTVTRAATSEVHLRADKALRFQVQPTDGDRTGLVTLAGHWRAATDEP